MGIGSVTPEPVMSPRFRRLVDTLDAVSAWSGKLFAWLVIPMVGCLVYEVVARYFFVFARLGSATMIAEALLAFELSPTLLLLLILGVIFLLGWPLEWVPIVLIVIPILLPAIEQLGVDLVWFCTLVAVCLQTAWLSPPVALSAYYIKGVVPDWDLKDIYLGMMQFMGIQVLGLLVVLFYPQIALWLPELLFRSGG